MASELSRLIDDELEKVQSSQQASDEKRLRTSLQIKGPEKQAVPPKWNELAFYKRKRVLIAGGLGIIFIILLWSFSGSRATSSGYNSSFEEPDSYSKPAGVQTSGNEDLSNSESEGFKAAEEPTSSLKSADVLKKKASDLSNSTSQILGLSNLTSPVPAPQEAFAPGIVNGSAPAPAPAPIPASSPMGLESPEMAPSPSPADSAKVGNGTANSLENGPAPAESKNSTLPGGPVAIKVGSGRRLKSEIVI